MARERERFRVVAAYDTETTNICIDGEHRAFCCLYIAADVRNVDMRKYELGDETVNLMRHQSDMLEYLNELMAYGCRCRFVPVVCAYNLMFDLQTILVELAASYRLEVCAQSSTHVYYMDVMGDDGERLLRFWDMYYLDMRGLAALGDVCGVPKLTGSWDYSLVRTPDTPLTEDEEAYAAHDVQILLAYLRYLLDANAWLEHGMLGQALLTKTGLVRQRALAEDYGLRRKSRRDTIGHMFEQLCMAELPKRYVDYALRKACFRGGLTFTSARYACCELSDVHSLDAVSMHHAFINGRYVPERFAPQPPSALQRAAEQVVAQPVGDLLKRYHQPFRVAFHGRFRFRNLRLKRGTVWDELRIGTLAEGKFRRVSFEASGDSARYADEVAKAAMHDSAEGAIMAYGKLMSAKVATLHLTELELYVTSMAYEWDSMEAVCGEATLSFAKPPDYVTLQSNELYKLKSELKGVVKAYEPGTSYAGELPESVPEGLAALMRSGELSGAALNGYYNSTVKGMYNGIYGTQAQDIYKPDYMVDESGVISVDRLTAVTAETWDESQPKRCRVLYTYGMRIVGGSRLHLALAMTLLYEAFGRRIVISGGDTDSMKIAAGGIEPGELEHALEPLHVAMDAAVDAAQQRVRQAFPERCASFERLGHFEIENERAYAAHVELWNKSRASLDAAGNVHVTCAGLSRPEEYSIEDAIGEAMGWGNSFAAAVELCMGWNATIDASITGMLQHARPHPRSRVRCEVTDYLGAACDIDLPAAIALYEDARTLGDLGKEANARSVRYTMSLGVLPDTRQRYVTHEHGELEVRYGI